MAVSTVSSLSETFVSGAPLELDEGLGEKEKSIQKGDEGSPQVLEANAAPETAGEAHTDGHETADISMGHGPSTEAVLGEGQTKPVEGGQEQPAKEDEGDEDAEGDDDDGDELQVHS